MRIVEPLEKMRKTDQYLVEKYKGNYINLLVVWRTVLEYILRKWAENISH